MRKILALTLALVLTVAVGTGAAAQWLLAGTGFGTVATGVVHAPQSVGATATGATTVEVSWSAPSAPSATPASYTVRRDGAVVCSGDTASPCEDSGLSPGTTYGYTVQSVLHSWTSAESAEVEVTTPAGVTPGLSFSSACPGVVDKNETWTSAVVSSVPTSASVTVTIAHGGNRGSVDKATVTIPAGQTTSDDFTYTRANHNGNDPSTITATASGYDPTPTCTITRQ